jgi:microcystin-dependent protein
MPNTVNKFLNVPNTGDLPGAWGTTAINRNMNSVDGILGGVTSIALSAATTFTLTLPAGATFTPGTGPSQSENAFINFSGTLGGNAICKFTMPGFYIIHNNCGSAASFSVKLSPAAGGGNSIGAPPGRKVHVFFDGTDMDYVDMPAVGSALDLHQSGKTLPVWMTACTISPYLIKDGTVYNAATYPQLAQVLGSTFGGNGVTTFGVPNEDARVRVAVDTGVGGRLTTAGCGVDGTTMGSAGGDQALAGHTHAAVVTDPGHTHTYTGPLGGTLAFVQGGANGIGKSNADGTTGSSVTGITVAITTTGGAVSGNVQPMIISFLALIKT